jgi:hypothetical protein
VREERGILISLVSEYRRELTKRVEELGKLEKLVEIRSGLRFQLEKLRAERLAIDSNMANEIETNRLSPVEATDQGTLWVELEDLRLRNSALEERLRQLMEYAQWVGQ